MKTNCKKLMATALAFVMVLCMLPSVSLTVHAETTPDGSIYHCDMWDSGNCNYVPSGEMECDWDCTVHDLGELTGHNWSNAVCVYCGEECKHPKAVVGECPTCGKDLGNGRDRLNPVYTGLQAVTEDQCLVADGADGATLYEVSDVVAFLDSFQTVAEVDGDTDGWSITLGNGTLYNVIIYESHNPDGDGVCTRCSKTLGGGSTLTVEDIITAIGTNECVAIYYDGAVQGETIGSANAVKYLNDSKLAISNIANSGNTWTFTLAGADMTLTVQPDGHTYDGYVCSNCTKINPTELTCTDETHGSHGFIVSVGTNNVRIWLIDEEGNAGETSPISFEGCEVMFGTAEPTVGTWYYFNNSTQTGGVCSNGPALPDVNDIIEELTANFYATEDGKGFALVEDGTYYIINDGSGTISVFAPEITYVVEASSKEGYDFQLRRSNNDYPLVYLNMDEEGGIAEVIHFEFETPYVMLPISDEDMITSADMMTKLTGSFTGTTDIEGTEVTATMVGDGSKISFTFDAVGAPTFTFDTFTKVAKVSDTLWLVVIYDKGSYKSLLVTEEDGEIASVTYMGVEMTADNSTHTHSWNDGYCSGCNTTCDHNGATTGTCATCGKTAGTNSDKSPATGDQNIVLLASIAFVSALAVCLFLAMTTKCYVGKYER